MIKVDVDKNQKEYPKLVRFSSGSVVLLEKKSVGVVIIPGESGYEIGHYSEKWNDRYTDFIGKITLSNG